MTNDRNDRPSDIKVMLDRVSLVSRRYRLECLPGQFVDKALSQQEVDWREHVTVHFRVVPIENQEDNCILSHCSFSDEPSATAACALSSLADHLCLEKANAKFEVRFSPIGILGTSVVVALLLTFLSFYLLRVRGHGDPTNWI